MVELENEAVFDNPSMVQMAVERDDTMAVETNVHFDSNHHVGQYSRLDCKVQT